jgi:hypothetical protein
LANKRNRSACIFYPRRSARARKGEEEYEARASVGGAAWRRRRRSRARRRSIWGRGFKDARQRGVFFRGEPANPIHRPRAAPNGAPPEGFLSRARPILARSFFPFFNIFYFFLKKTEQIT